MTDSLSSLTLWLLTYLMHSTALLSIAALCVFCLRRTGATAKERLWKFAATAPLLTATLQTGLSSVSSPWEITLSQDMPSVIPEPRDPAGMTTELEIGPQNLNFVYESAVPQVAAPDLRNHVVPDVQPAATTVVEYGPLPARRSDNVEGDVQLPIIEPGVADSFDVVDSITSVSPSERDSEFRAVVPAVDLKPAPVIPRLLGIACACLSLAGLLRLSVLTVRQAGFLRRCRLVESRESQYLKKLLRQRGIRRPVRLLASAACQEPSACGVFRWYIVVPDSMLDEVNLCQQQWRVLLAHEVGHLVRGDTRWQWIGQILVALFPWQPLNFVARRGWQRASEFQCDDWAVQKSEDRIRLAGVLTMIAEWKSSGGILPGVSAVAPPLTQRVERLLSEPSVARRPSRQLQMISTLTLIAIASGVTILSPQLSWAAQVIESGDAAVAESDIPSAEHERNAGASEELLELQAELNGLAVDLETAMSLLRSRQTAPEVHSKIDLLQARIEQLKQDTTNLTEQSVR